MSKLKNKKYVALLGIIVLVVGIITLVTYGRVDKYKGLVKLSNLKTDAKVLSSVGNVAGLESKGFDEVSYKLTYTLDEIEGLAQRDVVIKGTLTDDDFKYARFKEITGDNYSSVLSDEGKEIEITVNDVPLGVTQILEVKVVIEGAPNGTTIKPNIEIKEKTGEYTKATTEEIEVKTNSLQGKVTDEGNNGIGSIELVAYQNGTEVKRTYSNDNGDYTFTDLEKGNYEIKIDEEIYELVGASKVSITESNSSLNLTVKLVSPYSIETHKYIKKLNLIVNGKEENYTYKDAEKVVQSIKNAKTIEGTIEYKIVVKNTGEKEGTITQVIDEAGEGLKFDSKKNTGWESEDGTLKYKAIEGSKLKAKESREFSLTLDIEKTEEIKTYLNKLTANGEIYEKVVFIIDGQIYREDQVLQGETINKPQVMLDKFTGWYTDKNYTNKYKFSNAVNKDLILYGYTITNKCTVTFMDRGEVYDTQQVVCGGSATKPNDPVHEGYKFKEWKTENNNTFYFDKPVEIDTVVDSSYDLETYRITYNYNGGDLEEGKTNPTTYTIETPDFTLNNPSKAGYDFIGWTEQNGQTPSVTYTVRQGTTGDKTLTANYNIINYSIDYDYDGGSLEEGKTNPRTFTVETNDFTLNNPSKTGYRFIGWTGTGLDTATETVTIEKGSTENRSYKAIYEAEKYTITYKGLTTEEKETLNNPVEYTIEDEIVLNNPNTRKDDDGDNSEVFVGWKDKNGNVSLTVRIPVGSTGNRTYEATWETVDANTYAITYELHEGKLEEGKTNPTSYTKKTETFTLNNPSKKGYDFVGWSGTELEGTTNTEVTIAKGSRGNRSYEANYSLKEYGIEYENNCGEMTNPATYSVETDTFTLANPLKAGYEFTGWVTEDDDTKMMSVTIEKGSTGNKKYIATCTAKKYNITYDLDNGSLEEGKTNPSEYTIETETFTLNNPSKAGYTFTGWTSETITTPTTSVSVEKGSTGDINFVAHYQTIEYTITYNLDGGTLGVDEENNEITNPTTYTVETETFTLNNPSKDGSKFAGWSGTEITGKSTAVTIEKGSTGNREYTANWGANTFTVKFINEGNLYGAFSVNYLSTVTQPSNPSSNDNSKNFQYWSEENKELSENPTPFNFSTQINRDYTLYAIYETIEAPEITHTPTEWTNQNVTVTISSSHDDYTYKYKLNDGSYADYTDSFEVEENGTVYAYSNKNYRRSLEVTHEITNIDKIKPKVTSLSSSGISSNSFTIDVSARDDESGVASISVYKDDELVGEYLFTEDTDIGEKIKSITLSNLEENTSYHIKAVAKDRAGNVSDAFEKDISTGNIAVARIIGENNTLWNEEDYIEFPSLQEAIQYTDCVSSQCTIQMLQGTTESNVVLFGQDITLDLNGKMVKAANENYTLQNNGRLTIVDNNETESGIIYNENGTALLNADDNAILTLGVNENDPEVSQTNPTIVGKTYGVNKQAGKFNFYDGYVQASGAINGTVDDTPYLHNARISSIALNDTTIKQKAVLSKVADAEARIGTTYYTRLGDAIDKSRIGTMELTSTTETTLQDSLVTYGEYGFSCDSGICTPDANHIAESKSVIPIDLTDSTEDKVLLLEYTKYDSEQQLGSITISDALGVKESYENTIVTSSTSTEKQTVSLPKGKQYYLYINGNIKITGLNIGTTSMTSISNTSNYTFTNDGLLYGFNYDKTTKTLKTNNNYKSNTIAFSYVELDLTNETSTYEVSVNVSAEYLSSRSDYAYIIIKKDQIDFRANYSYINGNYGTYYKTLAYSRIDYSSYNNTDGVIRIENRNYDYEIAPGSKYYLEFYYFKDSSVTPIESYTSVGCKDEVVINSINVYPKTSGSEINLSENLKTYGNNGLTSTSSCYTGSGYKDCMISEYLNSGDYADSYIKIDLSQQSQDTVVSLSLKNYDTSSTDRYVYITDTEKNMKPSSIKTNRGNTVVFEEARSYYSYLPGESKSWFYTSGDPQTISVLLPKGRVYYVHVASISSSNYTTKSIYFISASVRPVGNLLFHLGNTPKVLHGNETPKIVSGDLDGRTDYVLQDGTEDNNLRFIGSNANNHITFNGEDWRIIGLFDTEDENGNIDKRIKIVRNDSIGNYSVDSTPNSNNNSGSGINEWSQADAMKLLNPGYEEESVGGSLYYNSTSGKCYTTGGNTSSDCDFSQTGLKESAKKFIDDVKWNTGALTVSDYTLTELYEYERGTETGKKGVSKEDNLWLDDIDRTTTWIGKVGLIYPSDYLYSSDGYTKETDEGVEEYDREHCLTTLDEDCITYSSWMYNSGSPVYTITPHNALGDTSKQIASSVTFMIPSGANFMDSNSGQSLFPVVYLSNKTEITSGTGTSDDPYIIRLGTDKNTDNDYGLVERNSEYEQFAKDTTSDQNYRYFGKNPNNYIQFNDELWRIIGIFKVEDSNGDESYRIKIMRSTSIGNYSWDSSMSDTNSGNGIDEWSQADLMKLLNPNYDNNTESLYENTATVNGNTTSYRTTYKGDNYVNNSLYWNSQSGSCFNNSSNYYTNCDFSESGLKDSAKKYIDTVKWNTGAIPFNYSNLTPFDIYTYERGTKTSKDESVFTNFPVADKVERTTSWIGKVALPYVSDFIMAAGDGSGNDRDACMSSLSNVYGDCSSGNNWMMGNIHMPQAMLSPLYGQSGSSYSYGFMHTFGYVTPYASPVSTAFVVKPALYLSTKTVVVGGDGSSSNPYTISLGTEKNATPYYGLVNVDTNANVEPGAVPVPEDFEDIDTDDYKKVKNIDMYGWTYDEDTNTYMPENTNIRNSLSSATIEVDLRNETITKKIRVQKNYSNNNFTFFVVNDNPDPINYTPNMSTCSSGGLNCNDTRQGTSEYDYSTVYLEPGKKWYIHLGFLNWAYGSYSGDESDTFSYIENDYTHNQYKGIQSIKIEMDQGEYTTNNIIKNYTYERNDDVDTVQVLKNITLTYPLNIEKERSVILDLNGYSVENYSDGTLLRNKGELEIVDSTLASNSDSNGKLLSSKGNVVTNDFGANLKLTSGKISDTKSNSGLNDLDENSSAVINLGTMQMNEDFTVESSSGIGINNIDGVIEDIAGKISAYYGINNVVDKELNGTNSGTITNMTGPLNITAKRRGIMNVDKVSNATINITGSGGSGTSIGYTEIYIKKGNDWTGVSGLFAGIYSPDRDVSIYNTNITSSDVGIISGHIDEMDNVAVNSTNTALYVNLDDESVLNNVNSKGNPAIGLFDGNFDYTDDSNLILDGAIHNTGEFKINLTERSITDGATQNIVNSGKGKMTIESFNPDDTNNKIYNSGTLKISDVTVSEITNEYAPSLDAENVTTTTFAGRLGSKGTFKNGTVKTSLAIGVDNSAHGDTSDITFVNTVIGSSDASSSTQFIYNEGTLRLNDGTVAYGKIKNDHGGNLYITGATTYNILSNGLYYTYDNSGNEYIHTGNTRVNIDGGSVLGEISIGTNLVGSKGYTSSLGSYNYHNSDYLTVNNSSTINGKILMYANVVGTIDNSTTSDIFNNGTLTIGNKDGEVHKNTPSLGEVENYEKGRINFYDGSISGGAEYPLYGAGFISAIEENYYLDQETNEGKNTLFLSNSVENYQIGENKYPTLSAAIASIEGNPTTPVEINIIRNHPIFGSAYNDKKIILDFKNYAVNKYNLQYLSNSPNGDVNIKASGGSLLHSGADSTRVVATSTSTSDAAIENNGTMQYNGLDMYGSNIATNGIFTMTSGSTCELSNYISGDVTVNEGSMGRLTNTGTAIVHNINVDNIWNSGNITVDKNHNCDTIVENFAVPTEKNVWFKSGSYKYFEQSRSTGGVDTQVIKIGDTNSNQTKVKENIKVSSGLLELTNTEVLNDKSESKSAAVYVYGSYTITNSVIKNTNTTSKDSEVALSVNSTGTITGSTITCTSRYTSSTCTAITGSPSVYNSTISGTTGISANTTYPVNIYSGSITSTNESIVGGCVNVNIVDGTIESSSGIAVDTYKVYDRYTSACENTINIGTNSDHNVIGNPSITANNSIGVRGSGEAKIYFANGTITAKTSGITGLSQTRSYYSGSRYIVNYTSADIYAGTIDVDATEGSIVINPTITASGGSAIISTPYASATTLSDIIVERGSYEGSSYGIYSDGTTSNLIIGKTGDSEVSETNPHIKGGINGIYTKSNNFNMYDGEVIGPISNSISGTIKTIEKDYTLVTEKGDSTERSYLTIPRIAQIGEKTYTSLAAAVEEANEGATIKIIQDYNYVESIGTTIIPEGKNIILDYDNHTINNKTTSDYIQNNGTIKIINYENSGSDAKLVNNGTMTLESSTLTSTVANSGNLTINSGTYSNVENATNESAVVDNILTVNDGTITTLTNEANFSSEGGTISTFNQNGGTASSKSNITNLVVNDGILNLVAGTTSNTTINSGILNLGVKDSAVSEELPKLSNGITFKTDDGLLNFYDGQIGKNGTYNVDSVTDRLLFNDVETNYNIVQNTDGNLVLKQGNIVKNISKDENNEYSSIQAAINDASSGDTLQLLKTIAPINAESSYTIPENKTIKFDFNGNSIYSRSNTFTNNGTLTLKNSTAFSPNMFALTIVNNAVLNNEEIAGTIRRFIITNNKTANLENIKTIGLYYVNNEGATMNLDGVECSSGTHENNGTQNVSNTSNFKLNVTNSGNLTLTNVTSSSSLNSKIDNTGTVDVENSTLALILYNNDENAVVNFNSGSITINGYNITNSGTINVTNAYINHTITNTGTVKYSSFAKNSSDKYSTLNVTNNANSSYEQTGGNNIGIVTSNNSTSEVSVKDGTLNAIVVEGANKIEIDNSTVSRLTINTGNIQADLSNNAVVSILYLQNNINGFVVNADSSKINVIYIDSTANKYYVANGTRANINLKNSSYLNYINDKNYYDGTGSTRDGYGMRFNIDAEDSFIEVGNRQFLIANEVKVKGGSFYGTITSTDYNWATCNFQDTTIKANSSISCRSADLNGVNYQGGYIGIKNGSDITVENSTINANIGGDDVDVIFKNTTLTGDIVSQKNNSKRGSLVMHSGTINGKVYVLQATIYSGTINAPANTTAVAAYEVTLGKKDGNVSTTDPSINGGILTSDTATAYGILATDFNFYDGIITGATDSISVTGTYDSEPDYILSKYKVSGVNTAKLIVQGEEETVAEVNGKYFGDLQAAFNDPDANGGTVILHRDVTLEEDVIIPEGVSTTIDLNDNRLTGEEHIKGPGTYTIIDSANPDAQGAIYRFLANLTGTEINPRDIIIYQMQDGNSLVANETYKLYKLIDNEYKIVKVNEENIGKYTVGSKTEQLRTVNGRVYVNGIGEGTYKLVSNTDREISFVIGETSISSNIKLNPNRASGQITASTVATLILQLQTGVIRTPYIVFISILLILITLGYVAVKKTKKQLI